MNYLYAKFGVFSFSRFCFLSCGHGSGPSADRVGSRCQWVGSGPNFRQVWRVGSGRVGSGPIIPSALNCR